MEFQSVADQMRRNGRLFAVAAGAIILAATCASFTSNYRPLLGMAKQRYLESQDRADWQVAAREAAAAREAERIAAEQAEQRRRAEALEAQRREEAARLAEERRKAEIARQKVLAAQKQAQEKANSRARMEKDYAALDQAIAEHIEQQRGRLTRVRGIIKQQEYHLATRPWPKASPHLPEDVRKASVCWDIPRRFRGLGGTYMSPSFVTSACATYHALSKGRKAHGEVRSFALLNLYASFLDERILELRKFPNARPDFLAYFWFDNIQYIATGEVQPWLPPATTSDGRINPALLGKQVRAYAAASIFGDQLVSGMDGEDTQAFVTNIYPRLVALQKTAVELARLCKALEYERCDNALNRYFAEE